MHFFGREVKLTEEEVQALLGMLDSMAVSEDDDEPGNDFCADDFIWDEVADEVIDRLPDETLDKIANELAARLTRIEQVQSNIQSRRASHEAELRRQRSEYPSLPQRDGDDGPSGPPALT